MPVKTLCLSVLLLATLSVTAQVTDSVLLKEVIINSYFSKQPLLRSPSSVAVIDSTQLAKQPDRSIVSVMNTVAGVRMEERSPGSYRLSIRGSLLRSPFGIRNVKIYLDDFPFTDAGGNTYLNLIDIESIKRIEIIKGPDGSLFGANSGGVARLDVLPTKNDSSAVTAAIHMGAYGYFHEYLAWRQQFRKGIFSLSEGWERSDGYRQNSSSNRKYIRGGMNYYYTNATTIKMLFIYSRLTYETPGALTLKEWIGNPKNARPASAVLPGAIEQKTGVTNNTLYGGLIHEIKFNGHFKHLLTLYGSHTNFENPFITNIEERKETTGGIRTWFEVNSNADNNIVWHWNTGAEGAQTRFDIKNYGNNAGDKDTLQAANNINAKQWFIFSRLSLDFFNRVNIEGALSYNHNEYDLPASTGDLKSKRSFAAQWMPRAAASVLVSKHVAWRVSVSRGYSTPTIAEILPSNNIINTSLQPESGWNYETGFRINIFSGRLWADASVFYYHLTNAIVRRVDSSGNEFFVNAGQTRQRGLELQTVIKIIKESITFIRSMELRNSYTYSNFIFSNYTNASNDYSGNRLTGVPQHVIITNLFMRIPLQLFISAQYNYTSSLPLNDANSAYAASYHLADIKAGWQHDTKHTSFEIAGGIKNIFNTKYSLGNDLNAAGGRYYNAAPTRNYFISLIACYK